MAHSFTDDGASERKAFYAGGAERRYFSASNPLPAAPSLTGGQRDPELQRFASSS